MQQRLTQWAILLLGLVIALGVVQFVRQRPPVYWSETKVRIVEPADPRPGGGDRPNMYVEHTSAEIALAGILASQLSDPGMPRTNSPDVTIVDLGAERARWIRVPDYGGQWANNFTDPVVDVQVSGTSQADVEARTKQTLDDINALLKKLQDDRKVPTNTRFTARVEMAGIHYNTSVGPARIAAWVLAAAVILLTVVADRAYAARRRERRRRERLLAVGSASPTQVAAP